MTDEHDNEPQASVPPTPVSPKTKHAMLPEERDSMMTGVSLGITMNIFCGCFGFASMFSSLVIDAISHTRSTTTTLYLIIEGAVLLALNGLAIGLAYLARKPFFGKGWLMGFAIIAAGMLVLIGTCLWANHG